MSYFGSVFQRSINIFYLQHIIMKKVLRIYGKKSISQHQKSFDEEAKKNGNIKIDFMCYLDFYYD